MKLFPILLATILVSVASALECYVCDNQENNNGKCTNTIKICDYGEDTCLTELKWGSTPYWQEGALKQYYISKRCSTKNKCLKYKYSNMAYCTHIWWQDWRCSECCKGDRCNYYIISGASRTHMPVSIILAAIFTARSIL
ncbi:uncharacterized protein LOC123313224 [Coccinella septempunctata]|uniref:uncharacterized protein LOC123313224 n=1 Tax=Coccinella septempunctata TaxID=41139 RepID=UPI001D072F78|nr:uncharacterized protein LOC123313224 [Coccinella septempunctata]